MPDQLIHTSKSYPMSHELVANHSIVNRLLNVAMPAEGYLIELSIIDKHCNHVCNPNMIYTII